MTEIYVEHQGYGRVVRLVDCGLDPDGEGPTGMTYTVYPAEHDGSTPERTDEAIDGLGGPTYCNTNIDEAATDALFDAFTSILEEMEPDE